MKLKAFIDMYSEDEIRGILNESGNDFTTDVDFEAFLMVSKFYGFHIYFSILLIETCFVTRKKNTASNLNRYVSVHKNTNN